MAQFPKRKKKKKRTKPINRDTVTWWKSKAWDQFSIFIRLRDALITQGSDDWLNCCSCGRPYPAFGKGCAQAGHLVPGRSHILLFDERAVNGQCYNCNQTLKGNWVKYEKFMLDKYGVEITERCKQMQYNGTFKYTYPELEEIRDYYKVLVKTLRQYICNGAVHKAIELLNNINLDMNGRPAADPAYSFNEQQISEMKWEGLQKEK